MKSREKSTYLPVMTPSIIQDEDDDGLTIVQFMDREFGRDRWVRDPLEDVFVAADPDYDGPGLRYIVHDRQRRRMTTTVLPHQIN